MGNVPTVRMWHEDLAVMSPNDDPLPLSKLSPDAHVHGGLRLEIAGRLVPYMGYRGPDDACFNQWLEELRHAAAALGSTIPAAIWRASGSEASGAGRASGQTMPRLPQHRSSGLRTGTGERTT